jgi:hypothetical protein
MTQLYACTEGGSRDSLLVNIFTTSPNLTFNISRVEEDFLPILAMQDPIPCPQFLHDFILPTATSLHLTTLPFHIHEVLLSFTFYTLFEKIVSPYISRKFFPRCYNTFPPRTRVNWDIHVTSFAQSLIICTATIYVLLTDTERIGSTWQERLYGYSGAGGLVQGMAAGYFMWDLTVCTINYSVLGPLDLLHGFIAGGVAILGFRPFALYYGLSYLLFELSTPFVNIHWMCDKVGMTGSTVQWYNGVVLIIMFFSCRLVWGCWVTVHFFGDVWRTLRAGPMTAAEVGKLGEGMAVQNSLPLWMAVLFCVGNLGLTGLNFFWFSKMIEAVRKRFRPEQGGTKQNGAISKSDSGKVKVR